jgi:cytochrome P450
MPALAELDLPEVDLVDPSIKGERWHEVMGELRDSGEWLVRTPLATLILDREAGEHFLRSKETIFPGVLLADIFGVTDGPLREQVVRNIININGADHGRLRRLVNPALSPRAADGWRPAMRAILTELWEPVAEVAGAAEGGEVEVELVERLTRPYPARVIAEVMGAPAEDADRLHDWSMWIQRQFDPIALSDPDQLATIQTKVGEFYDWVRPLIETRRDSPADDLISALIEAEAEGDRLDATELENLVLNILVGGVDTSQSQLAHALRLLASRPDQWAALRADPEGMAPRAVEESVRYEPITPITSRLLTEEVTYRDVTFPKDTVLAICSFTANRDPEAFADPDTFDITVEREGGSRRVLTFGAGIHYCVGANLARAEIAEALRFLAERIETLEPAEEPELQNVMGIYGVERLLVRATVR